MTKEKSTVPRLRFPGFTDAWKQRKLGEVAEMYSGGTPSVGRKDYYAGGIPFIRSAEINSDTTELYLTELGLNNSSAKMVSKGSLLYALYGATSGEVGLSRLDGAINQAILAILPNDDLTTEFLMYWLRREKSTIVEKYLQGGQGNLSAGIVKQLAPTLPTLPEQEAIGSFFSDLDQLITLHQRKLDEVKELKKALLQKMFPKGNGNDFPELRFPGFTDAWKQRKLGEVLKERNESRSPSADVPLVSFTVENGVTPKTERYNREFLVRDEDKKYKFTQLDDIVYNPANLKFGAIARNKYGAAVFSPIYVTYGVLSEAHPLFVELIVTSTNFIQRALRYQEGTVYERMAVKSFDLLRSEIPLPTLPEQEVIGSFFSDLDQLITLHQRQLDHLKLLKKALLQQMFI
ncbi:TPA: restriction endonuclease subunit S [Streptococcus suis]|nr:restriction endonuclease subunit S [Streptococcus suis]NQO17302.1 restriction endonuclease subunit S [Streptococcus suis]NQQ85829.1 restriction endonuclease subunit S [Streptococcus suis]HEM2796442.1 restriction endonuclease subunit S [Streptococcus suis]HEM5625268.1 restriction endonuclease subunit S [Streptococcus suis]